MSTLGNLVVDVAIEVAELHKFITQSPFYGASTGSNATASNYFNSILRLAGITPDKLMQSFRDIFVSLGPLFGYLSSHPLSVSISSVSLDFVNYSACVGDHNTRYLNNMARFISDPLYTPLCYYLALRAGVGLKPTHVAEARTPFSEPPRIDENNKNALIPDGTSILLVSMGSGNVTIDPALGGGLFIYNKVERATYPGITPIDNGLTSLTMTINDSSSIIPTCGIINLTGPVTMGGKETATVLRFHGYQRSDRSQRMWNGSFATNQFNSGLFMAGYCEIVKRFGVSHSMYQLSSVWSNQISHNRQLTVAGKNALLSFDGEFIFTYPCMEAIKLDTNYSDGQGIMGKR